MSSHVLLIIAVALVVASVCKYWDVNAAIPLIAAGFALDWIVPRTSDQLLDPELILTLVLTPLVFAAGLASSAVDLRRVKRSLLLLAFVLVVISTMVVGAVSWVIIPAVPIAAALALGAALAPTDAVAASIVAKKSGLPRDVVLVIEGESLANDGTALTILRVAVLAAVAGTVTVAEASGILALAVIGGAAIGAGGGWLVSWLMKVAREPVVANAILLLAPFALYEFSEKIGGSGLLTVVVAGVWIAHSTGKGSAYRSRLQAVSVWSLITFLLESFAFIVVGVEFLDTASLVTYPDRWQLALLSIALTAALLITRGLFMAGWFAIGPTFAPKKFADRKGTAKEFAAIGLLGVRGPVSVLAALSFPLDFPYRNLLLTLTFGVVVLSLLLSLFVTPLIQALHLTTETDAEALRAARIAVSRAALRQLDEDVLEAGRLGHPVPEKMERRLRSTAVRRVDSLQGSPERAQAAGNQLRTQRDLQRSMLHAERAELHRLRVDRHAPGHIIAKLTHELDVREAALGQPGRI